jgi:hypothetical protein
MSVAEGVSVGSARVREILLSFILKGGVTSFDLPFLFSDNNVKVGLPMVQKALDELMAEGNVKVKGHLPGRYSVTWQYWFRNVFDYTA